MWILGVFTGYAVAGNNRMIKFPFNPQDNGPLFENTDSIYIHTTFHGPTPALILSYNILHSRSKNTPAYKVWNGHMRMPSEVSSTPLINVYCGAIYAWPTEGGKTTQGPLALQSQD